MTEKAIYAELNARQDWIYLLRINDNTKLKCKSINGVLQY